MLDESPTPKTITQVGSASISTTTLKYGSDALEFSGTSAYYTAGAINDAAFDFRTGGDFTIEGWVNPGRVDVRQCIVSFMRQTGVTRPAGWFVHTVGSNLQFELWDNTGSPTFTLVAGAVGIGNWYHFAITRQGDVFRAFLGGSLGGTSSRAGDLFSDWGSLQLWVGRNNWPALPGQFNGYIDDLRITKGVARYTKNFLPPPAQLPAI